MNWMKMEAAKKAWEESNAREAAAWEEMWEKVREMMKEEAVVGGRRL